MPIFYVVYEGDAETAMKALNTCSQPWRQEEWMQYYLAKGVPNYVALKDFMDMYNLPISNAFLFSVMVLRMLQLLRKVCLTELVSIIMR